MKIKKIISCLVDKRSFYGASVAVLLLATSDNVLEVDDQRISLNTYL